MKRITTYAVSDLTYGKCSCCGENSSEILIDNGRCVDCIQMIEFENECFNMNTENEDWYDKEIG